MMKIQTEKLTGTALSWVVASIKGDQPQLDPIYPEGVTPQAYLLNVAREGDDPIYINFADRWDDAGPIIADEKIELSFNITKELWVASAVGCDIGPVEARDKSPLVAAMRAFVASKLGSQAEVPDELMPI